MKLKAVALVPAHNEPEETLRPTLEALAAQCPVLLCVNGEGEHSSQSTVRMVRSWGLDNVWVYDQPLPVGKAGVLYEAAHQLTDDVDVIVVVDADTRVAPGFVRKVVEPFTKSGVAVACGQTQSRELDDHRWHPLQHLRAITYLRFVVLHQRGRSVFGTQACIPGSNFAARRDVFLRCWPEKLTTLVDDTEFLGYVVRADAGKVVYTHDAIAQTEDPHTFRDWWKQTRRWYAGTFQAAWKFRYGTQKSWHDLWSAAWLFDTMLYIFLLPLIAVLLMSRVGLLPFAAALTIGYAGWAVVGAVILKRWRLAITWPLMPLMDVLNRAVTVAAMVYFVQNRTEISATTWESPTRGGR